MNKLGIVAQAYLSSGTVGALADQGENPTRSLKKEITTASVAVDLQLRGRG